MEGQLWWKTHALIIIFLYVSPPVLLCALLAWRIVVYLIVGVGLFVIVNPMYNETKEALKRAFSLSKILFGMGKENYNKLLNATSTITLPTEEELKRYEGFNKESAIIIDLQEKFKRVALANGFTEKQGLAMLEYASILREMGE